jgi:hypothetical protein
LASKRKEKFLQPKKKKFVMTKTIFLGDKVEMIMEADEYLNKRKTATNSHFELAEFSGIIVSHQVFVKPKMSGYELPAISKWQTLCNI